jgi:hypothetical protein
VNWDVGRIPNLHRKLAHTIKTSGKTLDGDRTNLRRSSTSTQGFEYQSVDAADEKPFRRGPPQHVDLLAQHQVLRLKFCSWSEQIDEHPPD